MFQIFVMVYKYLSFEVPVYMYATWGTTLPYYWVSETTGTIMHISNCRKYTWL